MEDIRSYILSVTAAAVLCALVTVLAGKGGTLPALVKLMCGIVLAATVIYPLAGFSAVNLSQYLEQIQFDASAAVEAGTFLSKEQTSTRIKEALETYILDKAAALSANICVEVTLEEDGMTPAGATMEGSISPFARIELETMILDELGIPREALRWK